MNNVEAQKLAPSYLHLPDDGAPYRCADCGTLQHYSNVVKYFTPDNKVHMTTCLDCMSDWWMKNAKDCGVAE